MMDVWHLYRDAIPAIARHWPYFWPLVGGVLGGVLGSFLECALYRVPRGLSLRHPPSCCPLCHTVLKVPDLVPVVSYLALGGRCRHCGGRIGGVALLLEATCVAAGVATVWALQVALFA